MVKYVPERVLQRYMLENYKKYNIREKPHDNKDAYPDLGWGYTEGNEESVPIEVEWSTKNFIRHGHDDDGKHSKNKGVVFCLTNDAPLGSDIKVIEIDSKHFEKWYVKNAGMLVKESIKPYVKKNVKKRQPKFWMIYLSKTMDLNWGIALKNQIWGFRDAFPSIGKLTQIQEGDLLGVIGTGRFPGIISGRIDKKTWKNKNFKGGFDKMEMYKITNGYYKDYKEIWPVEKSKLKTNKGKNEYFPHRFRFDSNPIIKVNNIIIKNLSEQSKEQLHNIYSADLNEIKDSILLDILFNSEA